MDQGAERALEHAAPVQADTIFAVASGSGRTAVAVLRISGPESGRLLDALCGRRPRPRFAALRTLRSRDQDVLDRGLVLWFPGPGSYTGEDCAELHLHGSRAVLGAVAEALVALGARLAAPGEFTRRAFLNGKMDLLEAEGVADLVEAETEAQRSQALRQMEGALGRLYRGWSDAVRDALALQEALIDFSDDEVPASAADELTATMTGTIAAIEAHLDDGRRGERIREGVVIALVGAPNVGKSSLLNALAGREVAIVAPVPGTTRDAVEARIELASVPVTVVDTAGLRDSDDPVEAEGIRRARARMASADLVVEVVDAAQPQGSGTANGLVVANKTDLQPAPAGSLGVSALTGAGIEELRRELACRVASLTARSGPPALTRERHRAHLHEAALQLGDALGASWPELRAEHLRRALASLGEITGESGTEAILDAIFGRFCIGK